MTFQSTAVSFQMRIIRTRLSTLVHGSTNVNSTGPGTGYKQFASQGKPLSQRTDFSWLVAELPSYQQTVNNCVDKQINTLSTSQKARIASLLFMAA
jgi:hypothetical protein